VINIGGEGISGCSILTNSDSFSSLGVSSNSSSSGLSNISERTFFTRSKSCVPAAVLVINAEGDGGGECVGELSSDSSSSTLQALKISSEVDCCGSISIGDRFGAEKSYETRFI
jgi:hypothetical protein